MAEDAERKKRASLFLALLLLAAAIVVTVISLQPDGRALEGSPPGDDSPTPSPSTPATTGLSSNGGTSSGTGTSSERAPGTGSSDGARCVLEGSGGMSCPKVFEIAGNAAGLYPGKTVPLPLRIDNPNEDDIHVTAIRVSVTATSSSSCDESNLNATDYTGPGFVVRGKDSSSIALQLTMPRSAPDACQRVTCTLAFTGEAGQA